MYRDVPLNRAYRLLHPCTVVIVTAEHGGSAGAMAAAWAMPVSVSPPLVCVSIAPTRFTHGLIEASGEFALNVADEGLLAAVDYVGSVSGREEDKIARLKAMGVRVGRARSISAPVIEDALAVLECRVWRSVEAGDHTVFIGEVVEAYAREEAFTDRYDLEKARPLMHVGGDLYTVPREVLRP